ncbi:MAG TPA: LysR family transcriptional regulator [Thermoanaerobaculia bacterium]|nr:LysR family transcriptional regulator [Thermoanaerobaculia bacterium]
MATSSTLSQRVDVRPRLRVYCGDDIALGPGKVELLATIAETGTLREAAQRMGLSYMRAWKLVRIMNRSFRAPLVVTSRGGAEKGKASLTEQGRQALALYRRMEEEALRALCSFQPEIEALLGDGPI